MATTADDSSTAITFTVPGYSGAVLPQGTLRGGPATTQRLPGSVKASVRVATQRDAGAPVQVTAVPGQDIVALHIEGGPVLLLHPATARDLLQGPQDSATARRDATGGGSVQVQADLHWPGAAAGAAGAPDPATRGLPGLDQLRRVVVSGFQVLTGLGGDDAADFAASAVVRHVDGQVDAGVYRLRANSLDPLKGSTARVAAIAPAATPILVLVHGTFVETTSTFGKLWLAHRSSVERLFEHYQDQVYALDHPTLGASPIANARTLVDALPGGARLHLVTHSRGGLVAEVLARVAGQHGVGDSDLAFFAGAGYAGQQQELRALGQLVRDKGVVVERVVRVACPARGTLLASKRLDAYLSVLRWTLESTGASVGAGFVDFIGEVARRRADPSMIPGLAAMIPDTPLVNWLNAAPQPIAGDLRVVAGDLQHGDTLGSWLKALLADAYYRTDNDIVVHTASMYGGAPRAGGATFLLDQGPNATHFSYFVNDSTADAIVSALVEVQPPAGFRTIGPLSWAGKATDGLRSAVGLPLGQAAASTADAGKPAVFILPGILGSNLKARRSQDGTPARIWLSPQLAGNFELLAYRPGDDGLVSDDGPVGLVYDKLIDFLSATHEVIPFGYDWRLPLEQEARRLAQRVRDALQARQASGQPVRLLAHSMGGLLARTLQLEEPDTWTQMLAHKDACLLMLGTPNAGSWAPMQVLSGDDTFGNALAAIGAPLANHRARTLMAQMPGFMQLQAGLLDPALALDQAATWQRLADADYQQELQRNWWQRYAGAVQTAAYQWGVPTQDVLDQARALRLRLDGQLAGALKTDAARLRLVVGHATFTPDGFRNNSVAAGSTDEGFVYLDAQDGGDGRVPLESALLPGVDTWTLDCEHGALPGATSAFSAYLQLLQTGLTAELPVLGASAAQRGSGGAPVLVPNRPSRRPPSGQPPGDIDAVFGGGLPATPTPADKAQLPALQVTVLNGNLTFVQQPLLLGHYSALQLTGTERVVDGHLSGAMRAALKAGIYPEAPGTHRVFVNSARSDSNPWQLPRPQAAIVIGLGAEGTLTVASLEHSVGQGVKAWAQRVAEDAAARASSAATGPAAASTGKAEPLPAAAAAVPGFELAATLIGSGGIGMSAGESARTIARGVRAANKRLQDIGWPLVTRLTLVEWYLDRAGDAWRGVHVLQAAEPGGYDIEPAIATGTAPLRRQPDGGYRGTDYDIITVSTQADDTIAYALDTRRARTEVRAQRTQGDLVRKLVGRAANAAQDDPRLGATLFKLLVPPELTPFLSGEGRMLLQLDSASAPIPWELLDTQPAHGGGTAQPWAIRSRLLRKLASSRFRDAPRDASADDAVLVIGAPLIDNPDYPDLPAALREAKTVADEFTGPRGIGASRVDALLGGAPFNLVINTLMARPYRIVHIAGHGAAPTYDTVDTTRQLTAGGVVLSEGVFLGPAEIETLSPVPQLVFVNCCHQGEFNGAKTLKLGKPADFAANLAEALINAGVRCVVAAGWAVDDKPAALFAQTFYAALLDRKPFVEAVHEARIAARKSDPNSKTWAAYQCYGDPAWVFHPEVQDAQTPATAATSTAASDEFDVIVSAPGLALTLESLAVRAQLALGRNRAAELLQVKATLTRLYRLHGDRWAGIGAVAEAFAVAWRASGNADEAILWYERALGANDASASLKAQEQLVNLRVRRAWRLARGAARGTAPLLAARNDIDAALGVLQALASLHPTMERLCLCGSAWKRMAQVLEVANGGKPSRDSRHALQQALAAYRSAEQRADSDGEPDLFYPASNRMALELALRPLRWQGFDAAALGRLDSHLQARHAQQPDFWSSVALLDFALYVALSQGQLAARVVELADGYAALHGRVQTLGHWESVADQLRFVLAPPRAPAGTAERDAAQRLLAQVSGYAARPAAVA